MKILYFIYLIILLFDLCILIRSIICLIKKCTCKGSYFNQLVVTLLIIFSYFACKLLNYEITLLLIVLVFSYLCFAVDSMIQLKAPVFFILICMVYGLIEGKNGFGFTIVLCFYQLALEISTYLLRNKKSR